ncbi:MAG: hypothetical protein LUE64_05845 [Candidatus Gastranaerophilales bacterium]|nr:hypothetical protein [Candidatus Gastranaerophilales bacterium]
MKKILLILGALVVFLMPANAKVFKGKAMDTISTKNPSAEISVKSVRNFDMQGIQIKRGYILTGTMSDVVHPKKWHHNSSFTFTPKYYTDKEGNRHNIDKTIKATYRQKMKPDFKNSYISSGSFTFSPGYVIDTARVFKGEGKEVVDEYVNRTTPWGKGVEIEIKPKEKIYFNFSE